jgi:hypothetical protein
MLTDFKISRIEQDDQGRIVSVVARVYEGEFVDQKNPVTGDRETVYRRVSLLSEQVLTEAALAGSADVDDAKALMCAQLAADPLRSAIDGQIFTADMAARVDVLVEAGLTIEEADGVDPK